MSFMKKHPFLQLDYHSTVKLSAAEKAKLSKWFTMASEVLEFLWDKKITTVKKPETLHVSLLICGEAKIKELNREYRGKDKVTDVLSFPAHEDLRRSKLKADELFLGDLAICHQQTKRQAREFKIGYFDEFIHLFFHGVIHLIGYDHEISPKEEKLMEKWEQIALEKFSEIKKGAR
jgi:probable rRNA maturation factor